MSNAEKGVFKKHPAKSGIFFMPKIKLFNPKGSISGLSMTGGITGYYFLFVGRFFLTIITSSPLSSSYSWATPLEY